MKHGLALRRPARVAEVRAGEVDHCVGTVHDVGSGACTSICSPTDTGHTGDTGARVMAGFARLQLTRQDADVVPFFRVLSASGPREIPCRRQ